MKHESYTRQATVITADGPVEHTVEHRRCPLTGRISTICPDLKEKWSSFVGETDKTLIQKLADDSATWCPFCQSIEEVTPAVSHIPEGRWHINDVWVFPNLFPRTEFEAVVTSPENHFLWLDELSPQFVHDHLTAALQCIADVHETNPALAYACIGWNYLPPAGASLVHPHMQVSMRDIQFNYPAFIEEKSTAYFNRTHHNFWKECVQDKRHIARLGRTEWITPYAPSGFNEIWAIVKEVSNFSELTAEDISNLANGISTVLRYYDDAGCSAFNMLLYSGALDDHSDHFWAGLRMISRPNVRPVYLSIDSWYMPKLLWEEIVADFPEDLADTVRAYFR
jgi:galactose-1-phosphate uridylyltransferase